MERQNRPTQSLVKTSDDGAPTFGRISRRQFLLRTLAPVGLVAFDEVMEETNVIRVVTQRLPTPGLNAPMRVAQLSDLHRSWCVSEGFIARIVARTNDLNPDLILLTGDFVTRSSSYIGSCIRPLTALRAKYGMYGILGNHDYACDKGRGIGIIKEALKSIGVQLLTNRSMRLAHGLRLVGVDDSQKGQPDPDAAFKRVRRGEAVLAMTHNPSLFPALCRYDCVTLAGHTHGGQINVPFVTRSVMPVRSRYLRGWFNEKHGPGRMYVTCGLGVVGLPFRFRCDPEISIFDLHPA